MNHKTIIGIFIGTVAFIGGVAWFGQPISDQNNSEASSAGGVLKSDEVSFDFGTISMGNKKVSHEFKITNSSDQPVNIRKIYTSCMCTAAKLTFNGEEYGPFGMAGHGGSALTTTNITFNPGDFGVINVVYDPNAHGPAGVGMIDRFVYVEDKNGSQLELEIKAMVTP